MYSVHFGSEVIMARRSDGEWMRTVGEEHTERGEKTSGIFLHTMDGVIGNKISDFVQLDGCWFSILLLYHWFGELR